MLAIWVEKEDIRFVLLAWLPLEMSPVCWSECTTNFFSLLVDFSEIW